MILSKFAVLLSFVLTMYSPSEAAIKHSECKADNYENNSIIEHEFDACPDSYYQLNAGGLSKTATREHDTEEHESYEYYDDWLFVGHSRIVGMAGSVPITYMARSAIGLDWLNEVYDELVSYRNYTIVFNFGINDYWNVYNYADFYNSLPDEFIENNCIYVMSENPVDEEKEPYYSYSSRNSTIEWFNENLKINLRDEIHFFDSYTYLQKNGFSTIDGVHYDRETNIKIYDYVTKTIMNDKQ